MFRVEAAVESRPDPNHHHHPHQEHHQHQEHHPHQQEHYPRQDHHSRQSEQKESKQSSKSRPRYRSNSVNRGTNPITPPPPPNTQQNSPPSVITQLPLGAGLPSDIPPPIPPHGIRVISPTPTLPLAPGFPACEGLPPVPPHQEDIQQQQGKQPKRGATVNGHHRSGSGGHSNAGTLQRPEKRLPRTPSELEREFGGDQVDQVDQAAIHLAVEVLEGVVGGQEEGGQPQVRNKSLERGHHRRNSSRKGNITFSLVLN